MSSGRDGRFAPSPTGDLHVGNLRTALLAWLFARRHGAAFTLRIEDLDRQRSRPEFEASQRADLEAIGIDWDFEATRQSERTERYREGLEALRGDGLVYECWCSRAEIRAAAQAPHGPLPEGAYPGTCRELTRAERDERRRGATRPASLRLDARAHEVAFEDAIHGRVVSTVDDFVLWRGDGTPAYNLAVLLDDVDGGVGEVVRGDDLLDTTPRQVLLASLFGLEAPSYAHVPLVLGPDGERLAKRHGAVTLSGRGREGMDPEAALGWMARTLRLAEADERPTAAELVERLDIERLPVEPAVFTG